MQLDEKVETRETLSADEFDREFLGRRPVVLTGMTEGWRARRWTPRYFAETFGDAEVYAELGSTVTGAVDETIDIDHRRVRLDRLIEEIEAGVPGCGYLSVYPIFVQFPALREHVDFPRFGWADSPVFNDFFLGPAGIVAPLHYDTMSSLFCQLYGTKSFTMIAPRHHDACYPTNECWLDGYSEVDVRDPDLSRFPRFAGIPTTEVVLEPGHMLYVPPGWWHIVRYHSLSISINQSFVGPDFAARHADELEGREMLGDYPGGFDASMVRWPT